MPFLLACAIAPIAPAILVGIASIASGWPRFDDPLGLALAYALIAGYFAYLHQIFLGIPALLIAQRRGPLTLPRILTGATLIGTIPYTIWLILLNADVALRPRDWLSIILFAVCGASAGLTWWWVESLASKAKSSKGIAV